MKIIVKTEELKQEILKQSEYIHDFLINKDDVKNLGKDWIIGLDSDKAGILMHLYMTPQIIEVEQQKVMSKKDLIGKAFTLDLGSTPVEVIVNDMTEDKVIVEYLKSTPGRIEEFTISDFEYFAMIKLESYE